MRKVTEEQTERALRIINEAFFQEAASANWWHDLREKAEELMDEIFASDETISDTLQDAAPKKKVFISQPMNGRSNEEIETERKAILDSLGDDYEEIKSFFKNDPLVKSKPLFCLSKSLELLADADVVVFAEGWHTARGCRIEHNCAKGYGIQMLYYDTVGGKCRFGDDCNTGEII